MGLFTRDAPTESARSAVTIIAAGNKFSGEMSIIGKMHIDGIFEGKISSLDSIAIGQRGQVSGVIKAQKINVCGLLEGEVHCEELCIEAGGQVQGVVFSKEMIIESQGSFVGERHLQSKSQGLPSDMAKQLEENAGQAGDMNMALQDLPDRVTLIDKKAGKSS